MPKPAEPSRIYRQINPDPYPTGLLLDLTDACNLRCSMCHYWGADGIYTRHRAATGAKPATLELDLALHLVEQLRPGTPSYSLFGGEPLLYPQLVELIAAIKAAGSTVSMVTNGTTLAKHAAMLVELGVDDIRVSIDGPREHSDALRGIGSYDRALAGIEALLVERERQGRSRPGLGIAFTVTPENHASIARFFHREIDIGLINFVGIHSYMFFPPQVGEAFQTLLEQEFGLSGRQHWRAQVRDPGRFDSIDCEELAAQIDSVRQLFRLHGGRGSVETTPRLATAQGLRGYFAADPDAMDERYAFCLAPWTTFQVTTRGEVLPCPGATDMVFGDLHRQRFLEVWHGPLYEKLRGRVLEQGLMPHCHACCMLYRMGHWRRPVVS